MARAPMSGFTRHQLQLQDRRLYQTGARARDAQSGVARDRPLRPGGSVADPPVCRTPIASLNRYTAGAISGPYFENQSVDYAIIDVAWNGILESVKIAAMADAYEVNVAPHNFNGHLGSLISAHMCAVVPNFKVMEIDIDDVVWKDDIVTVPPVIENGDSYCQGPGWGRRRQRGIRCHHSGGQLARKKKAAVTAEEAEAEQRSARRRRHKAARMATAAVAWARGDPPLTCGAGQSAGGRPRPLRQYRKSPFW